MMKKLSMVLLVDDDDTTNFLTQRLLLSLDVADRVAVALNGAEALALLAEAGAGFSPANPVLVLLDLNMPVMSGSDFLEACQPLPPRPPIRVAVLTSSTHPRDLERLRTFPHIALLHKPLTRDKLTTLLREHF